MCAINAKNETTITLLLKNNADVNATDNQQATCLHLAALKLNNPIALETQTRYRKKE
jgi:ankyrin repeat protein